MHFSQPRTTRGSRLAARRCSRSFWACGQRSPRCCARRGSGSYLVPCLQALAADVDAPSRSSTRRRTRDSPMPASPCRCSTLHGTHSSQGGSCSLRHRTHRRSYRWGPGTPRQLLPGPRGCVTPAPACGHAHNLARPQQRMRFNLCCHQGIGAIVCRRCVVSRSSLGQFAMPSCKARSSCSMCGTALASCHNSTSPPRCAL
mmetsp:Transcript_112261/g.194600  ORF Transcript_112261/g.194600 Transcript_112261/m.194600 type:complete len:201 (-) Transcript_112261:1600-2202(-)